MPSSTRRSRVFSISMPPEMAEKAMAMAKTQNRTMSELMRESFRVYEKNEIEQIMAQAATYAATRNPHGYTEDEIPRLIKEVRAEMRAEKEMSGVS